MTLFEKSLFLADGAGIAAFVVALLILLRWRPQITNAGFFFLVWAAVWLFEYYFLGENSYIHMDDEGDHFIPYYLNLINNHLEPPAPDGNPDEATWKFSAAAFARFLDVLFSDLREAISTESGRLDITKRYGMKACVDLTELFKGLDAFSHDRAQD